MTESTRFSRRRIVKETVDVSTGEVTVVGSQVIRSGSTMVTIHGGLFLRAIGLGVCAVEVLYYCLLSCKKDSFFFRADPLSAYREKGSVKTDANFNYGFRRLLTAGLIRKVERVKGKYEMHPLINMHWNVRITGNVEGWD